MNWEAISALATAFATLAALVLARRTEKRSEQAVEKMAGLIAATCVHQLIDVTENAERVSTSLAFRKEVVANNDRFPILLPTRWESAVGSLTPEILARLEALPNNAGYRAAEAFGSLRAIGHEIREFEIGSAGWHQMDASVRMEHLNRIQSVFHDAHVVLRAAAADFQKASKSNIKPLTAAEQGFVDSND